jgi:N-acyl-phosphatidylethanolamine-hydrolysing phospholipase D
MKRFTNPWPNPAQCLVDILRWKLARGNMERPLIENAPDTPAERLDLLPQDIAIPPAIGWRVVWLGHASFLLQGVGASILIDPVFSDYCAPLPFASFRRKVKLPCSVSDLPQLDMILLTHSHYDHLDLKTLRAIGDDTSIVIAEGHARWLRKKGFKNVQELPWHHGLEMATGIKIMATPAQHFTARTPFDRNRGHWCGFLIEGAMCKLWHTGDSGWCPAFQEIGKRYGPIDFGMIPIGAYNPRQIMKVMHMTPEEAILVFEETRCLRAVGMHWGTFKLTDEPMHEPVLRLTQELKRKNIVPDRFVAGRLGEIWEIKSAVN